jgi:hypothetical protein
MNLPRRRRTATTAWLGALGAAFVVGLLLLQLPAGALALPDPATPVTGNSTYFDGLGSPYGGCGMPQADLDSQDFVALNVFNTPGDYTFYPRPLPAAQASKIGMWNNGLNCGRWVQVTISDFCTGTNDGAPSQAFCRNGSWVADAYNGGVLNMLVADSCGDANAWCRDDPNHLDLSKPSLNRFVKNGAVQSDLLPNHFNNRHISWSFIPAPSYTGDLQIGFLQGAQQWWPAISVSHLANGIHGVEYLADGGWKQAQMNSDMGQSYIIGGLTSGASQFQIRVRDVTGALVNGGRVYSFSLPASCSAQCGVPYTKIAYTTNGSTPPPTSTPPTTTPPTTTPPSTAPGGACTITYLRQNEWAGGFTANVTVANTGGAAINGWTVRFALGGDQQVTSGWNATVTRDRHQRHRDQPQLQRDDRGRHEHLVRHPGHLDRQRCPTGDLHAQRHHLLGRLSRSLGRLSRNVAPSGAGT